MKKLITLLIALTATTLLNATGWVHMGNYPYVYDADKGAWTWVEAPVLWQMDIDTGFWHYTGTPLAQHAPTSIKGESIWIYSTLEDLFYHLSFSSTSSYYGTATVDGYSFGFYYAYKKVTNNQAQIIAYDGGQVYDYTLLFDSESAGSWDGNSINLDGVFAYYGSFQFAQ